MTKYKVSDTVKIRKDLKGDSCYDGLIVLPCMEKYTGKTAKIIEANNNNDINYYKLDVDNGGYWWTASMFECYEKYEIIRNGSTVIVTDGKRKGIAKCNPIDEFDLATGVKLAMERMEKDWPHIGDKYWTINFFELEEQNFIWDNISFDWKRMKNNNVFRTKEDAKEALKKVKEILVSYSVCK